MKRSLVILLWILAVVSALALSAANLVMGELNQDEGWYLYAARLVAEGQRPYVDFAFTQPPLLPLVYSRMQPLLAAGGLAAGRALTAAMSVAAALLAAALARRLVSSERAGEAALVAFTLTAVNVYQCYFGTVVKTYALCGLLLMSGAWLLAVARDRKSILLHALAGLALAGAAGTRISAGAALPLAGIYLLWQRERCGRASWLAFGVGGAAGLLAIFMPLLLAAPEAFCFFVLDYHSARDGGSFVSQLLFKAGCLSRVAQAYFVAVVLGIGLVASRMLGRPAAPRDPLTITLWSALGAIALVHLSAPFPYDDYQTPLFPLACALLAAALTRRLETASASARAVVAVVLFLGCAAAAASSPVNQQWMVLGRDRIWWRLRDQPALLQLRDVARDVRARSGDSGELVSHDIYLAVETGLRIPHGMEMGQFSYYPDLDREQAERLNVVNRELLEEILATSPAQVAALSGYSFIVAAPAVTRLSDREQQAWWTLVERYYAPVKTVPDFGQGATPLRIYERRPRGGGK